VPKKNYEMQQLTKPVCLNNIPFTLLSINKKVFAPVLTTRWSAHTNTKKNHINPTKQPYRITIQNMTPLPATPPDNAMDQFVNYEHCDNEN